MEIGLLWFDALLGEGNLPILFCSLELYLPDCHSLKEKRRVVKSVTERLRRRFSFSIAELEHQDLWQRSRLGAVTIGSNRLKLEKLSDIFLRESEGLLGRDLVDSYSEIIEFE